MSKIPNRLPDQKYLAECFVYDPNTGIVRWRQRPESHFNTSGMYKSFNTRYCGTKVGTPDMAGYIRVRLPKLIRLHRVIWKLVYGYEPASIDHIDGNTGNNRLGNLREVTYAENSQNRKMQVNNTTGYKGVHKMGNSYLARISVNNNRIRLGLFSTLEEAAEAYNQAAKTYHKEFTRNV